MNEFETFLRSLGLRPRNIVPDEQVRRCPTDDKPRSWNGAYWLAYDGRFGWGQNWAVHQEVVEWRAGKDTALPEFDPAELRRRRQEAQAARRRSIAEAQEFYERCKPLMGGHPYLDGKGLDMSGCRGLRIDDQGWLVVPMLRDGRVQSIQRIAPDGSKRFWAGAPTSGALYTINRRSAPITVLCEGLATGLAIFAAVPNTKIVVAFNAGNMPRVARGIPRRGLVCVAADNDHETEERIGENPGIVYAQKAADILGCGVAVPDEMAGTDWLDLRNERIEARTQEGDENIPGRITQIRRAVDAEISRAVMRAVKMARGTGS